MLSNSELFIQMRAESEISHREMQQYNDRKIRYIREEVKPSVVIVERSEIEGVIICEDGNVADKK